MIAAQGKVDHQPAAVKAYSHAVSGEEALNNGDAITARREFLRAAENYLQATEVTQDRLTVAALQLLSQHYASLAKDLETAKEENRAPLLPPRHQQPALNSRQEALTEEEPSGIVRREKEGGAAAPGGSQVVPHSDVENHLAQAEAEMDELWQKLQELGLSRGTSGEKAHLLSASRHLSSALGESFYVLPERQRATGLSDPRQHIDGGATLKAAAASRLRNQRTRLMQQAGHPPLAPSINLTARSKPKLNGATEKSVDLSDYSEQIKKLQQTNAEQQMEIMRLLQTVKTLSSENALLIKECEGKGRIETESKALKEQMAHFKQQYDTRFAALKRALEEWRRQRDRSQADSPGDSAARDSQSAMITQLRTQLQQTQMKLNAETEANRKKEVLIQRYQKWYNDIKAGAKAKMKAKEPGVPPRPPS